MKRKMKKARKTKRIDSVPQRLGGLRTPSNKAGLDGPNRGPAITDIKHARGRFDLDALRGPAITGSLTAYRARMTTSWTISSRSGSVATPRRPTTCGSRPGRRRRRRTGTSCGCYREVCAGRMTLEQAQREGDDVGASVMTSLGGLEPGPGPVTHHERREGLDARVTSALGKVARGVR